MIDLAAIQRRIKETVAVLDDFTKRRDPARTRQDYISLVSVWGSHCFECCGSFECASKCCWQRAGCQQGLASVL